MITSPVHAGLVSRKTTAVDITASLICKSYVYGSGDAKIYFNYHINISERDKPTTSNHHYKISSKSLVIFTIPKYQ